MKPYTHAKSSASKYGGVPDDYLDIHDLMDSSKGTIADNRHRTLTHNSWFLSNVLEKIFGCVRLNSAGREYSVRQIGEDHCLEDFGFIPSPQDYLMSMIMEDWMHGYAIKNNTDLPPSLGGSRTENNTANRPKSRATTTRTLSWKD
jgi:hypothetical protein